MTNVRIVLATVFLILLTAEVFFRIEPKFRKSTGIGAAENSRFLSVPTEFAPYVDGFNVKSFKSINLNTNAMGFRTEREITEDKAPGEKRIFILGGSAAIGWGATSDETTFALQLEKLLQQNGFSNAYVFNGGCDGYNSNQQWVLTATKIMDLKPDLLILFDGYNDLHYSMAQVWSPEYNIYSAQMLHQATFHPWYLHSKLLSFIDSKTKLARVRKSHSGRTALYRPEYLDTYLKNLRKIHAVVQPQKTKVLVALQPHFLVAQRDLHAAEKTILTTGHDYTMYPNYAETVTKLYALAKKRLKEDNPKYAWQFFDTNEWFADNSQHLFLDEVHLTDIGHAVVAQYLNDVILQNQMLGEPSNRSIAQRK